jgi:hypothetical protein
MESQAAFQTEDGQRHAVWVIDDPDVLGELREAFDAETLYVADGHHRYETALGYREEVRAAAANWTGEEPENFVMVVTDRGGGPRAPGAAHTPRHECETPLEEALARLRKASGDEPSRILALAVLTTAARTGIRYRIGRGGIGRDLPPVPR